MLLSPAKTLDLSRCAVDLPMTWPSCDADKTKRLAEAMKSRKEGELMKLLGISANVAKTAKQYWEDFVLDPKSSKDHKACIFAFSGAAYQGLDISQRSVESIEYMQNNLRIIDPLYGVLRPLDQIQPYRLEMATKGVLHDKSIKLSEYWKQSVTESICRDLESRCDRILANLASEEYSAALDSESLPENTAYIKIIFHEEGKVISVHAKRARGLMVQYISDNKLSSIDELKNFDLEGYQYIESKSTPNTLVFDRKKGSNKRKSDSNASRNMKRSK